MEKKFYVYIYFDPTRDLEPFYVGKGSGNRAKSHLWRNDRSMFVNRIKHIKNLGVLPTIEKFEGLTDREALELEAQLISQIGRKDLGLGPLCNMTNGGDGPSGLVVSDETRAKISERLKGNKIWLGKSHTHKSREQMSRARKGKQPSLGRILSDETKCKIGAGNKGKIISEEQKHKISLAISGELNGMYGKKHTEDTKDKIRKKAQGRIVSQETGQKISLANKGKINSLETKEKMKLAAIKNAKQLHKCNYCGAETTIQNISKYHGDRCKMKNNINKLIEY